jgi:hypothetical protein
MVDSASWGDRSGDHCGIVCWRLSDQVGRRRGLRRRLRLLGLRLLGYRCFMINFMIN